MAYNFLRQAKSIRNSFLCVHDTLDGYSTNFHENGNVDGWNVYTGVYLYTCWNSILFGTSYGRDPYIGRSSNILPTDAEAYYIIKILMKVTNNNPQKTAGGLTTGRIQWTLSGDPIWNSEKQADFEIHSDDQWHLYSINMGPYTKWQGDISNLRLYPYIDGWAGDQFSIKYIKISSVDNYTCNNTQCSYYVNYSHPCPGGGVRGSCESGLTKETYTTIADVSDKLAVNINNYGVEYFNLGTNKNCTAAEMARIIAGNVASVNVGCYAFSEVEQSELDKLKIYSGTVGDHSVVEVLDSPAARALGFYDEGGVCISTSSYGSNPATGFDYASSRLMTSLEINRLIDGTSDTFAYIHNPDQFNVEGGRRDFNEVGTSKLISKSSAGDYYPSLNNKGKTIIDLSHPINNNGRIKIIYVYGKIDTLSKIKILRPKSDGSYTVIHSVDMPLESGSYLYTTAPINYRVDCDLLVEKGDVIGVYNVDVYVGLTVNGRPDATFQQAVGDYAVGQTFTGGKVYSFGIAGFSIYGRGDRWQNNVILDIDLGDRVNIEEINVYGKEDSGEVEFNLAACLDLQWDVDLYGESHFHQGVNWANGQPWTHTHLNQYFGRECLDDCIRTCDNGQQGTSYTSGANGMETYGSPHAYFYVDGDAEWLYSAKCNGKTEYCNLMVPISPSIYAVTPVGGFDRDPISFTLTFPNDVYVLINKCIMYFKERNNFRSIELSYYLGPYGFGGNAYKDTRFVRIPEYTSIKLNGLEYTPDVKSSINRYIFKNPTSVDLQYTVGGTSKASNWEDWAASLEADWTIIEHNFEPIKCQGFRIYTNHHFSTKILELELYSKIQTSPSLLDNVSFMFSDYGEIWTDVLFTHVNDNKISGFVGGAPQYLRLEFNSSTAFELNEIECLVGDQVRVDDCNEAILLDSAPSNKLGQSTAFSIQNTYDRPFDLYVDIPTETSDSDGIVFWSKLKSYNDIIDPQIGPGCRLHKSDDYQIGNYRGQCAINTPAYALKNIVHDKKAYEYLYDSKWVPFDPPVLASGISLDYTNYSHTYYKQSVLEFKPISSTYWKFEHENYVSLKDVFALYDGEEIEIDKIYYGGLKGYTNPVIELNSGGVDIDASSSVVRDYYSDSFTGNNGELPDIARWTYSGSVSKYNNKMRLTANSSITSSILTASHALAGDFSVSIDYQIITGPNTLSWALRFEVLDTNSLLGFRWCRAYDTTGNIRSYWDYRDVNGTWTRLVSSTASPTSGTLTISRVGDVIGTYGAGVNFYSSSLSNSPFIFRVVLVSSANYPTVVADVDNYTINAGTDVAVNVTGMKLKGNDPIDAIKLFHSPQNNTDMVVKTSVNHNNNYAMWDIATSSGINNQSWHKYIAIDLDRRRDLEIIRNYGTATNKLWLSTSSNVDYSNTDTSDINNVVWNNSTKDDVRWLRIKLLMGDSVLRAIRKVGIYPDIGTSHSPSGGYNCEWQDLGYMLSDCSDPVNVAYGATVTGTNYYFRDLYPTNAVDGVTDEYKYQACWGFDNTVGETYLEIDFGDTYRINKVILHHGYSPDDSSYMNKNYNFKVSEDIDGDDFTTVFSITNNTSFTRTHQFDPVYARRARFYVTSYDSGRMYMYDNFTGEYIIFKGGLLREIEVYTYTDLGYIDSETWPVVCMNLLDEFNVVNHAVFNPDPAVKNNMWYNEDEYFRYSDSYVDDPYKVVFNRGGSTVQVYYNTQSSGDAQRSYEFVFTPEVYLEPGVYNLSWQAYYNQSVGEISLIITGPDIFEFQAQIISNNWATESAQLLIQNPGYYNIKAVQNIDESNNWGARNININRTAGLTRWVAVTCDTATNYSWDDDPDKYGIDQLTLLEVYGDTKYRPTEYSWWWSSIVSTLGHDYVKVRTGTRSLKISYPASTTMDTVQFLEGDHFGKDVEFSSKDLLHMWIYIDDVNKLDTTVGDITFGILNDNPQAYYTWYISNMNLHTGWNDIKLKFELADYAYPLPDDEDLAFGHINEGLDFRTNKRNFNSIRFRFKGLGSPFNLYIDDIKIQRNLFEDESRFGKGLCLTGYDYLEIPLAGVTLERGAIECWLKLYTTSYGLDIFGSMTSRSLFTMVNNNNDLISLGIKYGGWFSSNSGHARKGLQSFELNTTIIPEDQSFEIDDLVHVAVVWDHSGKHMDNDDTMRLYINGEKVAVSSTKWTVGDTKSMVIRLGGANTQLALDGAVFGSAIFSNVKMYNFCKMEFNPNEEGVDKDRVYAPNEFMQISADNINFYGLGDDGLPLKFSQIPAGESQVVYIRTNKTNAFGRDKTTGSILIGWLTTV